MTRAPKLLFGDWVKILIAMRIAVEDGSLEISDEDYEALRKKVALNRDAARIRHVAGVEP